MSFLKPVACCCSHINSLANHSNALSEVCLRHFSASEQTGMLFWNLEGTKKVAPETRDISSVNLGVG